MSRKKSSVPRGALEINRAVASAMANNFKAVGHPEALWNYDGPAIHGSERTSAVSRANRCRKEIGLPLMTKREKADLLHPSEEREEGLRKAAYEAKLKEENRKREEAEQAKKDEGKAKAPERMRKLLATIESSVGEMSDGQFEMFLQFFSSERELFNIVSRRR